MVGFAAHLDTTGGDRISADYPYYLTEALNRAWGPGLVVLFHPGAMGDLNHIDVQESTLCIKVAGAPIKGQSHPRKIGNALAGEVLKILASSVYTDDVSVDFAVTPVELPLRQVTAEAVAEAGRIIERIDIGKADFTLEVVAAWRDRGLTGMSGSLTTQVQAFRVGYVPTRRAYSEGGYEVTSTALAPGAGEKLVDAALGLLRGLAKS